MAKESGNGMFLLLALLLFVLSAPAASAMYTIQEFGTDGFRYASGANITVSGKLLNGTVGEPDANITLELYSSGGALLNSYNTATDSTGSFSEIIPASSLSAGIYSIVPSASGIGVTAQGININIYGSEDIKSIAISFTRGPVYTVTLNDTGYGNQPINNTPYYFFVSSGNTVSVDDDENINTTEIDSYGVNAIGNLVTNSRVKLGNNTYSVFFVNRASETVLARLVQPVFTGTENFRNLTLLALNSSGYPLSGKNLLINISNSSGVIATHSLTTGSGGLATANVSIPAASGIYTVQIIEGSETLGTMSFTVNSYDLAGDVLSSEWSSQRTFAKGQNATFAASVKTTGGAVMNDTQAGVTAHVRGPNGFSQHFNLAFDNNRSIFNYVYAIPNDAAQGTYTVEYNATIGSEALRSFSSFEVRGYTLFLKPVSGKRAELEGFSPGDPAYMLVSGTNLSTGDIANVNRITGNSNRSNFTFSIRNSEGTDVTGAWGVMSLDAFFSTTTVEPWLQDEIRAEAPNASVINFTAPGTEGIYDVRVTVNMEGGNEEASTSIGVQSIFLYAYPVSSDGNFAMTVSSQDNVTLRIEAFNPKTMSTETNITAAGIVEAFAVDANAIVTDSMLNPSLITLPDGSRALRFYNNDSNLGFHMVKFWANVTLRDGSTQRNTQAMGTGFFDVRLYYIWATPSLAEGSKFMTFTANSNISLRVRVMNTGFSPQSGKSVSIDEVRFGQNWEKIDFDKTSNNNWTGTTDSNGIANLSFTPFSPLKSGWYDVRIKLTAQDASGNTVTDYGRGWFEVRNFMFWAYADNWNVKAGQNISFTLQAVNISDMSSTFNASVRIKKVTLRTDWSQPPIEVPGPHMLNGSDTVDIATGIAASAQIEYSGRNITRSGMYEFVFEASSGGLTEEALSWVDVRPFVAWVTLPGDIWKNRFAVNNTINLIVHASDIWWGGTPVQLNASRTNITSVTKMGMFGGSKYKTQSELNITNVTQYSDGKAVNITLTLTDWEEGSYDMAVNAVDENGSEVITHFWMEVEVATVGLPVFHTARISESNVFTSRVSFNLTDTPSEKTSDSNNYPALNYSAASNSKVGKVGGYEIHFLKKGGEQTRQFWALVNLTEPRRLYVNYNNSNFSDTSPAYTQTMTVGDAFNELDGSNNTIRRWNVSSIGSDGTINLEGIDALNNGYIIDPSISKSGRFIVGELMDNEWLKVDLDGNGGYDRDWGNMSNRSNTYYIVLADNATSGIYDTVFVSNTTNFTRNGINATNNEPVTFGGAPIYFISLKKESASYIVQFTSYTTGWGGMWLGTFEKDKPLRVPFLVQQPGTTTGISGAAVVVDKLTRYAPGPDVPLPATSNTTDSNGLAIVNINTTTIPTGEYLISYRVTLGNKVKEVTEKWRMPGVEIRKFIVDAQIGNIGTISTRRITNGSGLTVLYGTEIEPRGVVSAYPYASNIYRVGWPFDMENEYYYNATSGGYYPGFDWGTGKTTGSQIPNSSINLTRGGANTTYNFTEFYQSGTTVSLNANVQTNVWRYWNITYLPPNILEVDYLLDDQPAQPPFTVSGGTRIYWGPGELNIEVIENPNADNVSLQLFQSKILYKVENLNALIDGDNSNGEWGLSRVTKVSYNGYDVYAYNDVNQTEIEKQGWWSSTLDRVLVTNGTWNNTYRIGERIPELNSEYVALAARWGGKVIFVNSTYGIFPFWDWAPDGDTYYVGSFRERDVNIDLNNNFNTNDNTPYYIKLEDNNANGIFNVTSGTFDDDNDFTIGWSSVPLDMYSVEQGQDVYGMKFDEKWLSIGSTWGWPFGVPEITYSYEYANLTTFSPRWEPFGLDENVTVYVNAKTFSNTPINGNVSLDKLIVLYKYNMSSGAEFGTKEASTSQFGKEPVEGGGSGAPEVYDIPNTTVSITNGIGVWRINYDMIQQSEVGSFDTGNFVARLNITDNAGNFEIVERSFFMQNRTAFGKGGYGCPPPPSPCGGITPPDSTPVPEEPEMSYPRSNSYFQQGEMIMFSNFSTSPAYTYNWTSNIDGLIGSSAEEYRPPIGNISRFLTFSLSPGVHTITLNVSGSEGVVESISKTVTVNPIAAASVSGQPANGTMMWDASNFPAFWSGNGYTSEVLNVVNISSTDRTIFNGGLYYNITRQVVPYIVYNATGNTATVENGLDASGSSVSNGGYYAKVGWFGKQYVGLKGKTNKLSRLILEQNTNASSKVTLLVGETWEIGDGWAITAQAIDAKASPRLVWLTLSKNGVKKDDKVIEQGKVYTYSERRSGGEADVPIFATYIDSIFAGATSDMVQLRYTWLISDNPIMLYAGDRIGNLTVFTAADDGLVLTNTGNDIVLPGNSTVSIADGMRFIVNDTSPLEYYPEMTVGGG